MLKYTSIFTKTVIQYCFIYELLQTKMSFFTLMSGMNCSSFKGKIM